MKFTAFLMIALALVIGILPQFSDCQSQGRQLTLENGKTVAMKCHWSAQAEVALAAPMLVTGSLLAINNKKENLRNLSLLGAALGVFVILLPTKLIGVCANPEMICSSIMKPSLILAGSLIILLSMIGVLQSMRMDNESA